MFLPPLGELLVRLSGSRKSRLDHYYRIMITQFRVQNFRCFDGNPHWVYFTLPLRGYGRFAGTPHQKADWIWRPLFHGFDVTQHVSIRGTNPDGGDSILTMALRPRSSVSVQVSDGLMASSELVLNHSHHKAECVMSVEANGEVATTPSAFTPRFPAYYLAARTPNPFEEDGQLFGNLKIEKSSFELLPILQILEPRLRSIDVSPSPSGLILYGDVGLSRMQPLGLQCRLR